MQPSLQCSLCMWFWLCLFTWPGMKARLKGRANTIKAYPHSPVRLEGTGRQTDRGIGPQCPPTPPLSHTMGSSTKLVTMVLVGGPTVFSVAGAAGGCWCVLLCCCCFFSAGPPFDSLLLLTDDSHDLKRPCHKLPFDCVAIPSTV